MSTTAWAVVVVFGALSAIGWAGRWGAAWRRRQLTARVASPMRVARGVRARCQVTAGSALPGMAVGRSNVTTVDLAVDGSRLVVASTRGLLVDVGVGRGLPLRSVRSAGPDRFVVEGDTPRLQGEPASWRLDLVLPDAPGWEAAARPFARPSAVP